MQGKNFRIHSLLFSNPGKPVAAQVPLYRGAKRDKINFVLTRRKRLRCAF
jgi:hypothetical protein